MDFEVKKFPAEWTKYGKSAGPIRNSEMIKIADEVLALPNSDSIGTYDTINKAKNKGIDIKIIDL